MTSSKEPTARQSTGSPSEFEVGEGRQRYRIVLESLPIVALCGDEPVDTIRLDDAMQILLDHHYSVNEGIAADHFEISTTKGD